MTTQIRMASLALAAAVLAAPAGAATMQAVYTGTVNNGYDETGLFGTPQTFLDGLAYSVTYTYDTGLGNLSSGLGTDTLTGGSAYGTQSPLLSAVVSIGGIAQSLLGSYQTYIAVTDLAAAGIGSVGINTVHLADDSTTDPLSGNSTTRYVGLSAQDTTLAGPFTITSPFTAPSLGGNFLHSVIDAATGTGTQTYVVFNPGLLTVTTVGGGGGGGPAPVPLPASALALLAGLGGIGAMRLRRRSQRQRD